MLLSEIFPIFALAFENEQFTMNNEQLSTTSLTYCPTVSVAPSAATYYSLFTIHYSLNGLWLSVDPMSEKYPHLSAFTYCADNPVRCVDPDGEEVYITGDDASAVTKAFEQLQSSTSYKLELKDNGKVEIVGGKASYNEDKLLANAINGDENDNVLGGAFMGNEITKHGELEIPKPFLLTGGFEHVDTKQTVDPYECAGIDNYGTFNNMDGQFSATYGSTMLHEVTESYLGGKIALLLNIPLSPAIRGNSTYNLFLQAHNSASKQPDFNPNHIPKINQYAKQIRP